ARLAAETPRQIANAHTIFNIANTLIFIGFTGPLAWLVTRLVPGRPEAQSTVVHPRYLDDLLLDTPALALDRVRMELRRTGERAYQMVAASIPMVFQGSKEDLLALAKSDDEIDVLHKDIVTYLGHLSQENLSTAHSKLLYDYITASNNIENIGDMVESNIVKAGLERLQTNLNISEATQQALGALHSKVCWAVQLALQALDASSPSMALSVIDAKEDINRLAHQAEIHLANRLAQNSEDRLPLYQIEAEIIEYLKRVYYFSERIAQVTANMTQEVNPFSDDPPAGPNGFGVKPIMERPKDLPLTTASPGQYQPASPGAGAAVGG
ncbi:MAG: PhoU domain-containing protein, partial [Anaerolineae bacterium]|nr:PhoU domain-containing protein [Anaerolineae bacterium]